MGNPLDEVRVIRFESVERVVDLIKEKYSRTDLRIGFRGHRESTWELAPSFSRYIESISDDIHNEHKKGPNYREEIANRLYEQFKENLIVYGDIDETSINSIDLWQLGQHFGLASPYLDWTYSPYIALFFALEEQGVSGEDGAPDRCLWMLDTDLLSVLNDFVREQVWPRNKEKLLPNSLLVQQFPIMEIAREINGSNRRLVFQKGFFTKHVFYRSFEVWVNRIVDEFPQKISAYPLLTKLEFPCEGAARVRALDMLDSMNINHRSLFPDIQGSVKGALETVRRSFRQSPRKSFSFSSPD
ncbi:MAG TPA: FRG domain-containing protein [Gammaproteobacteria bacterium]